MSNEEKFEISSSCPNPQTCTLLGDCVAKQLLDHELDTRLPPVKGIILPSQHDAIESLMRAAKCTDTGFITTLWNAFTFLIHNPRE